MHTQEPVCTPVKYLPTASPAKERRFNGVLLLGDSWNMRHPLTGSGMTVALRDAEALANALFGQDGRTIGSLSDQEMCRRVQEFRTCRLALAGTVNLLANALHSVFTVPAHCNGSGDATHSSLREACLEYFHLGGACAAGPVGLLAGLTPSPAILIAHFFFVAAIGVKRSMLPYPTWARAKQSMRVLQRACAIIMPLLRHEHVTMLSWPSVQCVLRRAIPWKEDKH